MYHVFHRNNGWNTFAAAYNRFIITDSYMLLVMNRMLETLYFNEDGFCT